MTMPTLEQLPAPPEGKTGWPWTEQTPAMPPRQPDGSRWPKISIVTTNYNFDQFIEETIRSVLLQGYPELEYIIIDDGSSDNSMQIIEKYAPWLAHWEHQENQGQTPATNKGLALATGDALAFICSDDYSAPGAFQRVGKEFAKGAQWVCGPVLLFGPSIEDRVREPIRERSPVEWFGKNPIAETGSFWATRLTREYGLFDLDLNYLIDVEFWLRLRFVAGVRPVIVDQMMGGHRFHGVSKSMTESGNFPAEIEHVRKMYAKYLTGPQRLRLWFRLRRFGAGKVQSRALALAEQGRRCSALMCLAQSVWQWPGLLLHRRTAGTVKRIFSSGTAGGESATNVSAG